MRRLLLLVGTTLLLLVASGGTAVAHSGGLESEPFLPRVLALDPPVPGLWVGVVEGGARLGVVNDSAFAVDVLPAGSARAEEPVVAPGERGHWADARVVTSGPGPVTWSVPLQVGGQLVTVRGETVWPPPPATGGWWAATAALAVATAVLGTVAVRRRAAALAVAA
uniref:hypothetical protein n=1 Tax=Pseudonocardia pini TaxID=2758030 RepID=UPI001C68C102